MNTTTFIEYLQIFGLTIFGLFFLALLSLTIYLFFFFKYIRKSSEILINDIINLISLVEDEAQSISNIIKSKLNSFDVQKILFGTTILGGIISGLKNVRSKTKSSKVKK